MRDIHIGPAAQRAVLGTLLAAIAALVAVQLPDLRRYLKIRAM